MTTPVTNNNLGNVVNTQNGNNTVNTTGSNNSSGNAANTNSTAGSSTAAGTTNAAQTALSQDFQNYLQLLTTQLQNQDPTQPMDTNEMTAQLSQLGMLQQQIDTNQSMQQLLAAYNTSQINGVVGYIGQRVEATGNTTILQNGAAELVYNLASAASKATITIKDSNGNVVYTGASSQLGAGRNVIDWNGSDSVTGGTAPDGIYTYTISATDTSGNPVTATTSTTGPVTAVNVVSGTPTLQLGGSFSVPLSSITKIEPDPLASASTQTASQANGTNG